MYSKLAGLDGINYYFLLNYLQYYTSVVTTTVLSVTLYTIIVLFKITTHKLVTSFFTLINCVSGTMNSGLGLFFDLFNSNQLGCGNY